MAGIIFIGKEIDDKLANEVIGVLLMTQIAICKDVHLEHLMTDLSAKALFGFRGTLFHTFRMKRFLPTSDGLLMPGQQQADLLVHQ